MLEKKKIKKKNATYEIHWIKSIVQLNTYVTQLNK